MRLSRLICDIASHGPAL